MNEVWRGQICVQWNLGHVGTRHFVSTLGPGILSAHWDQAFCQHIGTRHFVSTLGPGILSAHWDQVLGPGILSAHWDQAYCQRGCPVFEG